MVDLPTICNYLDLPLQHASERILKTMRRPLGPIVLAGVGDPVQAGLVSSLLHPGSNVTGVSRLSPDFIGKESN